MLIVLLVVSLALLLAGVVLSFFGAEVMPAWPTAFWVHLILAVGVMSMITAAMQHFAPVLARSRGPGVFLARLPWLMLFAGGMALAVFAGFVPLHGLALAAGLALAGGGATLLWMRRLQRMALGGPHPGLAWYVAAMGLLGLGLLAAALIPFLPEHHVALRAFHLNINLFGFVGLTAVGTLQVLMPTLANAPDPGASPRLRLDLKWAVAGAVLLALGAAMALPLIAGLGLLSGLWPVLRMGLAWIRLYRPALVSMHGGEPLLLVAVLGFAGTFCMAWLDTLAMGLSDPPLAMIFVTGFLFPLFSAAAGQLAPVWRRPGVATEWHAESRRRLLRFGGVRALLFALSWLMLLAGSCCAVVPALLGLFGFVVVFADWLWRG